MRPPHNFLIALLFCLTATPTHAIDDYTLGPDSQIQEGVPRGEVTQYSGPAEFSRERCAITGSMSQNNTTRQNQRV